VNGNHVAPVFQEFLSAEGVVNEDYPAREVGVKKDRFSRMIFQGSLYPHRRQVASIGISSTGSGG